MVDGELADLVNVAKENEVTNTLIMKAGDPVAQEVWDARSQFETAVQETTTAMDEADVVVRSTRSH